MVKSRPKKSRPYERTVPATEIRDLPLMLDTRCAAQLAGVSAKHIRDLCAEKVIHAVKVGTAWRIPRDSYIAWLGLSN